MLAFSVLFFLNPLFLMGAVAGAIITVLVPAVFNFIRKELGYAEADLPKGTPAPPLPAPEPEAAVKK
jgi:hypothetical protein